MGKHFSFIHCADLHLGEPFGGLYSGDTALGQKLYIKRLLRLLKM